ncbi:hypothetical protein RHMOL_Rhmol10G0249600 [Rhododendron molle]|uniref:Uncharacterized protein n=1 Tax=Rhododendron molle TaxID=49168 RepID=A0ACC0M6E6_RHOML|nr:hypothetical protein RHMOL_Rhmol10G0249600 [Rhododendron molle]
MTNPGRSITATSPVVLLSLLLSAAAAAPTAAAQTSTDPSSSSLGSSYSNVNPSMAIFIMVLFFAFFLMGFLSFYIRYCNPDTANSGLTTAERQRRLKPGLDREVIDSFPIFRYSDVKDLKIGKGGSLECAVCVAEFENDDTLRLLPKCDHVFHPECIDAWLASHSTCPVCRANLAPSQEELGQVTESTQSSDSDGAQNQNQDETQISVDAEEGGNREPVRASEFPKRKIPRSHSTGHSLNQPGENLERYTLRLPVELRREMMSRRSGGSLKRTISCVIVLPTSEGSSRRGGGGGGGEGSSSRGRSDRWVFSMTPPFLSRARFVASPKVGFDGDLTAVLGSSRSFLANVRAPFDCIAVKSDGVGQTSTWPPV